MGMDVVYESTVKLATTQTAAGIRTAAGPLLSNSLPEIGLIMMIVIALNKKNKPTCSKCTASPNKAIKLSNPP
ncbi:hypothetical protein D3C71_1812080 [compost metagenome]